MGNFFKIDYLLTLTLIIVFTIFGSINSMAQTKRQFTPEDMWKMKRVGAPAVNPAGNLVAFPVTDFDIEKNTSATNIYVLNLLTNELKQFTRGNSDNTPVWSPDGTQLAFLSRRDGSTTQLYIIPISGGEAKKITNLPVSIAAPKWFPDGKRLAFSAQILPEYNGDFELLEKLLKEKKESKMTAKVTEHRIYRFWDRWLTDGMYPRLFKVDLSSEKVTDLMPNTNNYFSMYGPADYDISPDGKEIAVSINNTPPPFDDLSYDIFLLQTDGSGVLKNVTEANPASDYSPRYSPDGNFILYTRQLRQDFYADNVKPIIYERKTQKINEIAKEIDMSFEQMIWSKDSKTLYFHAESRGMKSLFSIPSNGGKVIEIFRSGTNDNVELATNNQLIFTHNNLQKPNDLYSISPDGKNLKQLTFFNKELLAEMNFGKVEDITYKGANGADVQMFVVYPPNFDPKKKWPLMLMIHGGPHGIFGDAFHFRWNAHLFAAPGYVVAFPNFHGSTSFGQEFAVSIHGDHPTKPYIDVMNAADYLIAKDFIDEKKMAAAGGSYGGYLVSWIAGHTDRFACLINHAGVYNLMQQFGSDITSYRDVAYGGTPWDGLDRMQKVNPAVFAKNFKTPMLVIHGEKDYRVPVTHALEVYGIYKGMGLDARLVYYPDENHWILTPQNSIYWYKEVYDWYERYLK